MFAIALGGVWRDIEGTVSELPSERVEEAPDAASSDDELSRRRRHRRVV